MKRLSSERTSHLNKLIDFDGAIEISSSTSWITMSGVRALQQQSRNSSIMLNIIYKTRHKVRHSSTITVGKIAKI